MVSMPLYWRGKETFFTALIWFQVTLRRELQSANIQIILPIFNDQGLLAISSELSQSIIFVNSENFEKTAELSVGGPPQGMAAANGQLYVAENQTNSVSMLNPQSRL